ncbi:MAG: tetratricopeptide repeat protein [Pyrinomonadaceae bacterium]
MTMTPVILGLILALHPLQSRFAIIGSVRDDGGQIVGAIRITLLGENYQTIRTVFADSSGRFQFRNLGEGTYTVRVEPAGTPYEEESQKIELQTLSPRRSATEEPWFIDFRLRRKAQPRVTHGVVFVQEVPTGAKELYERGQSSFRDQKPELGIPALKKAIEIFPDYFLALELLGTEYVKSGEYEQALSILTHAVQVNPDAAKCLYALGFACLKSNRSVEAIEWLQKAADKDPKNPNVYMMLGLAHGNIGTLSEAETSFRKAYVLGKSEVAEVHWYLAGIYDKQKKFSEAARELELYLKEAKNLRDKNQIRGMIERLRAKGNPGD